jgi:pSer/pThr/pTyr-binding forkhead associated (FHA) protein
MIILGMSIKSIIKVKIKSGNSAGKEYTFGNSFTIGRSDECSIQLNEGGISRIHVEVICNNGIWTIEDKSSRNGTYVNGSRIERCDVKENTLIELGKNGPTMLITSGIISEAESYSYSSESPGKSNIPIQPVEKIEKPVITKIDQDFSVTNYIKHYFDENKDDRDMGEHTKFIRQAYKIVKKKQSSKYRKIIIAVGIITLLIASYALYENIKENKQKALAENIFYDMKSLELEIASFRNELSASRDPNMVKSLEKFDERHRQLEKNYDRLVDDLGIYNLNENDKLIVKTARIFGECEFAIPKEFIAEVKNYIGKWQSSPRLINALERADQRGFTQIVINYLKRNHLPEQFFYLALQESDFKETIVGPETRYGYAKGIWNIGPLADKNVYDPGDDRFNFPKATSAAARYIRDIYDTDAQASGLLVIASYNWGEQNIINLIRSMPENPRERNFWKLLEKYKDKIPVETYNYVFYIFSAAVICENPHLFGFNFNNPLKNTNE